MHRHKHSLPKCSECFSKGPAASERGFPLKMKWKSNEYILFVLHVSPSLSLLSASFRSLCRSLSSHWRTPVTPRYMQKTHTHTHTGGQSLAFQFPVDEPAWLLNVVETDVEFLLLSSSTHNMCRYILHNCNCVSVRLCVRVVTGDWSVSNTPAMLMCPGRKIQ